MQLQAGELVVDIKVNSTDALAALKAIEQRGQQVAQTLNSRLSAAHSAAAQSSTRQATALQRTQDAMLRMAMSEARLASATGNTADAVRILEQALQQVTVRTQAAVQAETMLVRQQQQLAGTSRSLRQSLEQIAQAGGTVVGAFYAIGTAFGASLIADAAIQSGKLALQLNDVQLSLRAIAGSQELFNTAMEKAAFFQRLYGGTLADNASRLQDFVMISKRTGAEMEKLIETAQLLAIVKPEQGIEGASYALSELLAGDLVSIVERFNLSRSAVREYLNEFKRTGDANRLLEGINELLAKQGVTLDVVNERAQSLSVTYNQLGASLERVQRNVGQALAEGFAPAARGLTFILDGISGAPNEIEQAVASIGKNLLEGAKSFDEYRQAVQQTNAELQTIRDKQFIGAALPNIEQLSEAQFTYFQYLKATGASFDEAYQKASQYGQELVDLGDGQYMVVESSDALRRAQELLQQAQIDAAETARRAALLRENEAQTLYQEAAGKIAARVETERLSLAQQQLEQAILNAAYSGASLDTQIQSIATQFSLTEQEVRTLVTEYQNLILAQQNVNAALTATASAQLLSSYQSQLLQQRQQELSTAVQTAAQTVQSAAGDASVYESAVATLASEMDINVDVARNLLDAYLALQEATADAEQNTNALLLARIEEAAQSEAASLAYQTLDATIRDAALSGEDAEVVSQRLAEQFGVEAEQVYKAIIAYQQLQQQQGNTQQSGYQLAATQIENSLQAQLLKVAHDELAVAIEAVAQEGGDTSAKMRELAQRYNLTEDTVKRLVEAYRNLQKARDQAKGALEGLGVPRPQNPFAPRSAGGGSRGTRTSTRTAKTDEQRQLEQQAREQQRLQEQIERDTERHYERLAQLYERFQERMRQAEQAFAQSQLEGRADFYNALSRFEDNELRKRLSAAYEQGVLEAQQLAVDKGADVADAYLEELTKTLLARAQREQAIAQAMMEGDAGQAEYLRGVDELYRRVEQARLERIKQGEASIQAEYQQSVAEQEQAFLKSAQEWTLREQDKKQAVLETNAALREQVALVRQLSGNTPDIRAGGAIPAIAPLGGASASAVETLLQRIEQAIRDVQRAIELLRSPMLIGV
ncbi:MAG: hypothetical protein KatS3mg054_0167 [Chloroflexus sp.]|nr:MAG: hypothetical protein KatS3mg054_0167 [Chloroflexus sp.]